MSANILYVCSHVDPYTPDGLIAKMSRQIPQFVQEQGMQVRMFMPLYGLINERRGQLHEVIRLSGMNLILAQSDHQLIIKVASIAGARLQVYFIDNEEYFSRKYFFAGENGEFFEDNDLRGMFFSRGTIETVKKLRWAPDVVHLQGWMAAFMALYLGRSSKVDPIFGRAKVVVSLYADNFAGQLDVGMVGRLKKDGLKGLEQSALAAGTDYISLMKAAIECSSGVVVCQDGVSPELVDYAKELGLPVLENIQKDPAADGTVELTPDLGTTYKAFYEQILSQTEPQK